MAAIPLGKLSLIIGAGIVGSVLSQEGRLSDVTGFFSSALKVVTKHLQQDKNKSPSAKKPHTDLLTQVNNLRQELQVLSSSRAVTTGRRSAVGRTAQFFSVCTIMTFFPGSFTFSVTGVIVVGVLGYGYIWWKGWKLSDMMFVTGRGFSDVCNSVGKQVDEVSSSVKYEEEEVNALTTKRELVSRINRVDSNLDECNAITSASKDEVSSLPGDVSAIQQKFESVKLAVYTLESRLVGIDNTQDDANRGVVQLVDLCNQNVEQIRNVQFIQNSQSRSSRQAIEHQQNVAVSRTISLPPLALEASSPSSSSEFPKVVRSSCVVKELPEVSNEIKAWNSIRRVQNLVPAAEEPSSSSTSSSYWFWSKFPGTSVFNRAHNPATR